MALADLDIDPRVAALLEAQGIQSLYPPQEEAWKSVRTGRNTVVAIPTASGKSLVAYLAILHRWLATGKKALYIVPLRALASEKYDELLAFKSLGVNVGVSTGDLDERDNRLGRFDVIVCTSEKADALLRHRTPWVDDIGCIVADELHLIHDAGRGPTLEVLLSRFRSLIPKAQIVGLSATIDNADVVAKWLGAALVESEWRPTKLHLGTYWGDRLEFLDQPPRQLPSGGDPVASLVEETLKGGGQCLVFVSTRKSAEAQAQKLAGLVRELLDAPALAALEDATAALGGDEESATGRKLSKLVRAGVAYHTAGLDSKQRRAIEDAFRKGSIKALCATPTLAAGVNTPARRVIVRDLRRFDAGEGSRPLPVMEVKQMMGRAGRPRYDPYGEAVLLAKSQEEKAAIEETYLRGGPEPITSKLGADAALRMHTLASIAGGYCDSAESLRAFYGHSFWAQEADDWLVRDRVEETVDFLHDNGFVEAAGPRLSATLFGKRTSDLYIDPLSALRMKEAMESKAAEPAEPKSDSTVAEATTFGLLEVVAGCPDLLPLYLRQSDEWVQNRFWEHHEELLVASDGRDLEATLSYAKTAFLLMDWMDEKPLEELEERYVVGPGDLRMRIDNASWLLHAFRELSRSQRPAWQQALGDLSLRLEHGVQAPLLALIRLRGIGRIRARILWNAGFHSVGDIAKAPASRLAALSGFGPKLAVDLLKQVGVEAETPEPPKQGKGQASMLDFDR